MIAARGFSLLHVISSCCMAACYFYWSDRINPGPKPGWGRYDDGFSASKEVKACVSFGYMAGTFLLISAAFFLCNAVVPLHVPNPNLGQNWANKIWMFHLLVVIVIAHPFGIVFGGIMAHLFRPVGPTVPNSGRLIILMPVVGLLFDLFGSMLLMKAKKLGGQWAGATQPVAQQFVQQQPVQQAVPYKDVEVAKPQQQQQMTPMMVQQPMNVQMYAPAPVSYIQNPYVPRF